jgi:biopolymer transport protein ExbD
MVTTTYSRFTELKVNLPTAGADRPADRPRQIVVGVSADGRYQVDGIATPFASPAAFSRILEQASRGAEPIPLLVIEADAAAPHQAVVNVMEAARLAGLAKVTFAAQGGGASR